MTNRHMRRVTNGLDSKCCFKVYWIYPEMTSYDKLSLNQFVLRIFNFFHFFKEWININSQDVSIFSYPTVQSTCPRTLQQTLLTGILNISNNSNNNINNLHHHTSPVYVHPKLWKTTTPGNNPIKTQTTVKLYFDG